MRQLILTFHGLGEPPLPVSDSERKVWVPSQWLDDVLAARPHAALRLAFDDGNRSDIEHALPILTRRGASAIFFILAGQLGSPGRIDADALARLHAAGMKIGSHGLNHRNWRRIGDHELERELVDSRATLAEIIGEPVLEAAIPFGSYDRRVLSALRSAGYKRVYSSDGGACSSTAWLAARTSINLGRTREQWLEFASTGPAVRPDPVLLAKRGLKRVR